MKKVIAIIFTIVIAFSFTMFGTFIASAEAWHVTEQKMTFDIGGGNERTGIYTGPLENNLPHGRGRFEWEHDGNLCVYEGDFVGGVLQGQGTMTIQAKNGEWIYTGDFVGGDPQGQFERVSDVGIFALINGGGILGFALWLVIALMIFLVMLWVTALLEMIKRYSLYRKARLAGMLSSELSFWKMSGAAFAELSDTLKTKQLTFRHEKYGTSIIVGKKSLISQITGISNIIAIDVWWVICYGFNYIFWIFVGSTIWVIVKSIIESISVEDSVVKINGSNVPYESITDVSTKGKARIIIKTNAGKRYKLSIINAQAVSDAIKVRINGV